MNKRILNEAKADIESGIAKSLTNSKLTLEELESLEVLGTSCLMVDHGLDSIMAEIVKNHVKQERNRVTYQHQMTRDQLKESIRKSVNCIIKD